MGALTQGKTHGRAKSGDATGVIAEQFLIASGGRAAGECFSRRGIVIPHRMMQTPDESHPVHQACRPRQVLAHAKAGN